MLYKNKYSLPINDFISFQVTNYYNVKYSLFQYMSMYVYHGNNGDGNINCIICAWSFCLVYDK
jgi:hypothetical protein